MTNDIPDLLDLPDTDLQTLFVGVHPAAGFEDRLVTAVRQQRRLRLVIPIAVQRAAIAAAAVLAVGSVGYFGSQAMNGQLRMPRWNTIERYKPEANSVNTEGRMLVAGLTGGLEVEKQAGIAQSKNQTMSEWNFDLPSSGDRKMKNPDVNFGFAADTKINLSDSTVNRFAGNQHDNFFTGRLETLASVPSNSSGSITKGTETSDSILLPIARQGDGDADTTIIPTVKNDALGTNGQTPVGTPQVGFGELNQNAMGLRFDTTRREPQIITGNVSGLNYFHGGQDNKGSNGSASVDAPQSAGQQAPTVNPTYFAAGTGLRENAGGDNAKSESTLRSQSEKVSRFTTDREKAVVGLIQDAQQFTDDGKFIEALSAADKIQQLDPNNPYATGVRQFLEDKAANPTQRKYANSYNFNFTKQLNDAKENVIPYGDITRYSPDGPKTSQMRDGEKLDGTQLAYGGGSPKMAPPRQPANAQPPGAGNQQPEQATAPVIDDRKIIRTGSMEFDVDRFDAAQMQITKIVLELGGFVGATDSQKLPNGKVRGSISVRVPPERLDLLVLSLRALGDLKAQQITAADITKEYTDLQSELTADRAMQERLLALIKSGNGSVKDLLAAENDLGEWRTKIEKAEGMIRYYNGQVALSTLSITLTERDIQTPATAIETETADVGIEAEDVEKARNNALKAIDDVKGRIVEAELKRFDAGQLAARLVADVPPESAGAVIDQLKQLGKVARLEIHRQETNTNGDANANGAAPLHTERKPTRLLISIYNLANVAPRRTTNASLAALDVEAAYAALVAITKSSGGRVVTSALDRGDPAKASGSLVLELPPEKFDAAMTTLHAQGDVLKLNLTENPDTQNSTEAKQGLTVRLISLASVPPRETVQQTLAAPDVPTAYQAILSAANSTHSRIQTASLNEQDRQNITADVQAEVPRAELADFDKALSAAGGTIARTSGRSADAEGTVDSKVQVKLSVISADHLAPRETTKLQVEVGDVDKSANDAQAAAIAAGGRVLESNITKDHGKGIARIILDFPLDKSQDLLAQIRSEGPVRGIDSSRDPQAPTGPLAHGQIYVEFRTTEAIVADQTGPWASVRQGLSTSITGLLWSLEWVVVGLCLIGPWAGIGWAGWKMWKRRSVAKPGV